jgi:hypothetical protein
MGKRNFYRFLGCYEVDFEVSETICDEVMDLPDSILIRQTQRSRAA